MAKQTIWTETARRLLFEELVARFGPCRDWQAADLPSDDTAQEFAKFLTDFAALIGAKGPEAVLIQIERVTSNVRRTTACKLIAPAALILNTAAAIYTGFITMSEVPLLSHGGSAAGEVED